MSPGGASPESSRGFSRVMVSRVSVQAGIRVPLLPTLLLLTLLLPGWPSPASAQERPVLETTERLDFRRPEAWAMARFTQVALLTGMGPLATPAPGAIQVELDGGWIPQLDAGERRVGFNGQKDEDLNKAPAFGRIRVGLGLPGGWWATVGIVPPVEIGGATPLLLSASLGRTLLRTRAWTLDARLLGHGGRVRGDFTCPARVAAAGMDPEANPYMCEEPSRDRVSQRTVGLETTLGHRRGRWTSHLALGANWMKLDFRVRALYTGIDDRSLLETDGPGMWGTAGVGTAVTDRLDLGTELFYSPLRVMRPPATDPGTEGLLHLRGILRYRVR